MIYALCFKDVIQNPERLTALHDLMLLDSPAEDAFDRLTRLGSKILDAPISLVSLIDADRQFFKSALGLSEKLTLERQTPLSHSFCQHVVATGEPLIVEDARPHPLVYDNLAISDLNVIGYLGIPLNTTQGIGLGSYCVIDSKPRQWTKLEIEIMRDLAKLVMTEIELRREILLRQKMEKHLRQAYSEADSNNLRLQRVTELARSTIEKSIAAIEHGAVDGEVLIYLKTAQSSLKREAK